MFRVLLFLTGVLCVSQVVQGNPYTQFIHTTAVKQESNLNKWLTFHNDEAMDGSFALIIAVSEYEHLKPLPSTKRDADKMKNVLLNRLNYDEVVVLQDKDATKANISYFMETYFPQKVEKEGNYRFLFYYSGHGSQVETPNGNTLGYIQLGASDGRISNPETIDMNQLSNWANRFFYAKQMLFLLDCCFSGLAGVEVKSYDTRLDPKDLAKLSGRHMITAGGYDEESIASEREWGGSLFTDVCINGMGGAADTDDDGVVTLNELYSYTNSAVMKEAKRVEHKQTPQMNKLGTFRDDGQFFFVYDEPNPAPVEVVDDVIVEKKGQSFTQTLPGGVKLDMVYIPGGSFMMGSPESEKDRDGDEGPQRRVTIEPFYMGKYEVTQAQWQAVMGTTPQQQRDKADKAWPMRGEGDTYPMYYVSWEEAVAFCQKLSQQTGQTYRLPTEAEWEYAARSGGQAERFAGFSEDSQLYRYGNFCDTNCEYSWKDEKQNDGHKYTAPAGSYVPNGLGLFDMSGNVWEWCQDTWHSDYTGAPTDGSAWESGDSSKRVVRGGSWNDYGRRCRSANRSYNSPVNRFSSFGFRLVFVP